MSTRPQPINPKQVREYLVSARSKANAARANLTIDLEVAYQIAYEAMLKASLALMLSYGQRQRAQLGHHIAIIEFAETKLGKAHPSLFSLFDRMRRKRNSAFYDITLVSNAEAEQAVLTAEQYLTIIEADVDHRLN
jgi:uncharacterized protein (UPF0332 family)